MSRSLWRAPVIACSLLVFGTGCHDSPTEVGGRGFAPAVVPLACAPPSASRLLADMDRDIGAVNVWNDAQTLYVEYEVDDAANALGLTQLAVGGTIDDIPANGKRNPNPSKFPWAMTHSPYVTGQIYQIAIADIPSVAPLGPGGEVVIAAHAEIGDGGAGAWGNGELFREKGNWATWFPHVLADCGTTAGPTAVIDAPQPQTSVESGQPLAFDGSTSTDPAGGGLDYHWDFGDGSMGGGGQIAHIFAKTGSHTVRLTVVDGAGASDSEQLTVNVTAGPAAAGTTTLHGLVTDGTGPLAGIEVERDGVVLAATDAAGAVEIDGFPTGIPVLLKMAGAGYAEAYVLVEIPEPSDAGFFEVALRSRGAAGGIADAASGGAVSGQDGVRLSLPPNALVDGAGNLVAGPVSVTMTPVDVRGDGVAEFPGAFAGILSDGTRSTILSLGVAEFLVTDGSGAELQLAPGARATIDIPIYTQGAAAGDVIPLWSLDEATGLWIHEGDGTVVATGGLVLRAEIGHLSWWNADVPGGVIALFLGCEAQGLPAGIDCAVDARTDDDDASWRGVEIIDASGQGLAVIPGRPIRFTARIFASPCLLLGEIVVDVPLQNAPPVVIPMSCAGGGVLPTRIAYDELVSGDISPSGDADRWVFAGTAGDEIRIDLNGLGLSGAYLLHDPDGTLIASGTFSSLRRVFRTLQTTGDYIIEIAGEFTDETGPYELLVSKLTPDPTTNLPTLPAITSGTLGFPGEIDRYTFAGTQDQEIAFAAGADISVSSQLNGTVTLRGPGNAIIAQETFSSTIGGRALKLPADGTYTVEVTPSSNYPAPYVMRLAPTPSTLLADDYDSNSVLAIGLEVEAYRFTGPAGDVVRIDAVRNDGVGDNMRLRVHDAAGALVASQGFDDDPVRSVFVTLNGGEYRVSLLGSTTVATGAYDIAYSVFAQGPPVPIAYGDQVTDGIGYPPEVDAWTFDGTAGEQIQVSVETASGSALEGDVRLIAPSGATEAGGAFSTASNYGATLTLAETGGYTIEVDGSGGMPGDYVISLQELGGPGSLPSGELTAATLDFNGGVDEYTFTAAAGERRRFHVTPTASSNLQGRFTLLDGTGAMVVTLAFRADLPLNSVQMLSAGGSYTVQVEALANAPGSYQIGMGSGDARIDPTFGTSGRTIVTASLSSEIALRRMLLLPDDRIIVVGDKKIWRFSSGGALDGTFGVSGLTDMNASFTSIVATAAALQPDGKIVVAGIVSGQWFVARYNANGSLDSGFGTGGGTSIPLGADITSRPFAVRVLSDGDILVGGRVEPGPGLPLAGLARLNADGSLDSAFGGGTGYLSESHAVGNGMGVQSTGRILLAGTASGVINVRAYLADGTPDLSFGGAGTGIATFPALSSGVVRDVMVLSDDRIVLVGDNSVNGYAVRLDANGGADATFGASGITQVDLGHREWFMGAALDAAGRLVVAGRMDINSSGVRQGLLVRFGTDGLLDSTFGIGGFLVEPLIESAQSAAFDALGRIVVGANESATRDRAQLVRFLH